MAISFLQMLSNACHETNQSGCRPCRLRRSIMTGIRKINSVIWRRQADEG
jgi:hypothetical protein